MVNSRLCKHCETKHAQHASRPYCASCARELGLAAPYRYRHTMNADAPPLKRHFVRHVEPPPPAPPVEPPTHRTITVNGHDFEVIWDGKGPLPGASHDTPRNLGSSLRDTSRVIS